MSDQTEKKKTREEEMGLQPTGKDSIPYYLSRLVDVVKQSLVDVGLPVLWSVSISDCAAMEKSETDTIRNDECSGKLMMKAFVPSNQKDEDWTEHFIEVGFEHHNGILSIRDVNDTPDIVSLNMMIRGKMQFPQDNLVTAPDGSKPVTIYNDRQVFPSMALMEQMFELIRRVIIYIETVPGYPVPTSARMPQAPWWGGKAYPRMATTPDQHVTTENRPKKDPPGDEKPKITLA